MSSQVRRGHASRSAWPLHRLLKERNIALGSSISLATTITYRHALRSWDEFIRLHNFPLCPSATSLSYFIAWLSTFISPRSVSSYLSGIFHHLEPSFPDVRQLRSHSLVLRTLKGVKRLHNRPVRRKDPLATSDLARVVGSYSSPSHDDLLFISILLTGFFSLQRLGELVQLDKLSLRDSRKAALRSSVCFCWDLFEYILPASKADAFFDGNKIVVLREPAGPDPFHAFARYIGSRDALPHCTFVPFLWIRANGTIPTRAWFMARLRLFFPPSISGHSLRAGGATSLALAGVPENRIQAMGRWSSDARRR